jgi:cellulose biosynthesis protein BcsQ
MVDFDVHHRGLTVLRTKDQISGCRTIHEYLSDDQLEFYGAQDVTPSENPCAQGREYLIPSSKLAAQKIFDSITRLKPDILVDRLTKLCTFAAEKYQIDLILVDCGPIVDPLTASATYMSDMAFIIGQNEPITFQSLQNYALRIRDFIPEFSASKVRVLLNKVRGPIIQKSGIFSAIPFTMEVVDYSEGLENIDEVRLIFLDYCVHGIIKSIFENKYKDLIPGPEAILTQNQRKIIDNIVYLPSSKWFNRLKKRIISLFAGCDILLLLGIVCIILPEFKVLNEHSILQWITESFTIYIFIVGLTLGGLGSYFYVNFRQANSIIEFNEKNGYEGFLGLLTSREGRKKYNKMQKYSKKSEKDLEK